MSKQKLHTAEEYARQVMSGEVLVCEFVRLAVERYYADLDAALDRGWHFDRKAATRAINFIQKLKHTKGVWAGQRFRLEFLAEYLAIGLLGFARVDGLLLDAGTNPVKKLVHAAN